MPAPLRLSRSGMHRELENLSVQHNPDGKRGLLRSRDPSRDPAIPSRMASLFHSGPAREHNCSGGRKLEPIHSDPNVYLVRHFLSDHELDRFDEILTCRRRSFKQSHTDSDELGALLGTDRTSSSLALPKSADATLRAIETRASELVGLPSDYVEPLQIVHYTDGAKFECHHDLGQMEIAPLAKIAPNPHDDILVPAGTDSTSQHVNGLSDTFRHEKEGTVVVHTPTGARRLVTIFVYLNTLPEGIGHTHFPLINLSVRPRSGTALVFCNVKLSGQPDARLCHE